MSRETGPVLASCTSVEPPKCWISNIEGQNADVEQTRRHNLWRVKNSLYDQMAYTSYPLPKLSHLLPTLYHYPCLMCFITPFALPYPTSSRHSSATSISHHHFANGPTSHVLQGYIAPLLASHGNLVCLSHKNIWLIPFVYSLHGCVGFLLVLRWLYSFQKHPHWLFVFLWNLP